jgi:hypothetical protein
MTRYHVVGSLVVLANGLAYLGDAFTPSRALARMTLASPGSSMSPASSPH